MTMDFDPKELLYPLRMEWIDEETDVFDDMFQFVTGVEFLDGMRDDPEFKLFDASGRRLYFLVWALNIKRVSFVPDEGPGPSDVGDDSTIGCLGCGLLLAALVVWFV